MKQFGALILSFFLLALCFSGCSRGGTIDNGANEADYPVTVNEVTLSAKPEGVAVLSDNLADVILALGYEIDLKARGDVCTQKDLRVLPVATMDDAASMQQLGVTLLLTEEDPTQEQKDTLNSSGITVVTLQTADSRTDLERLYTEVASLMRGGNTGYRRGQDIAANILTTLDDINRVIPKSNRITTACYLYDLDGHAVTGDQFASVVFSCAGVTNAFSGETDGTISQDSFRRADPDYIFCSADVKETLMTDASYSSLTAVKRQQVIEMEESEIARLGRTAITTASFVAGTVYPELLKTGSESSAEESSGPENSGESSAQEGYKTLQAGDSGDEVKKLQERLDELGYMFVPCSGEYGAATTQAVCDFQLLNGMSTTGIADEEMQKRLYSDQAVSRTD